MFLNIRPKLIRPIPWGWENKTDKATGVPIAITHPGKVQMPDLVEYYDWDAWELAFPPDHWGSIKGCGTRDNKSIFTTALRFLGWEGYATANPADVFDPIIRGFLRWNVKLLEAARGVLGYFMVGDDYASNAGMMISPESWREHIKPGLAALFDMAKWSGCINIMHTDGDISEILDDILDLRIDMLNCQAVGGTSELQDGERLRGVKVWIESEQDFKYRGYTPLPARKAVTK